MRDEKKRLDYRHIICILITLGFVAITIFVFPNALSRLIESFRDFGLSIAYYFCELFGIEYGFTPTVNDLPDLVLFPSLPIADTWEGFKSDWCKYWQLWANWNNFTGYLGFVGNRVYYLCYAVVVALPFVIMLVLLFRHCLSKTNNEYNVDSKPLQAFKKVMDHTVRPVVSWVKSFIAFIKEHKAYYIIWAVIWAYNFNFITICIEFLAFYFYFVMSFDVINIYRQVYKLVFDLWSMVHFIPLWLWIIVAAVIFDKFRKKIAYVTLNHYEMKNRGFINARPIVYMVCGTMGKKKTTAITDMALSQEVMFRDKAFEKILENDMKFPNFPWVNLENAIKCEMDKHTVYNLATVRKYIRHLSSCFYAAKTDKSVYKSIKRHLKKRYNLRYDNLCFDYDYERYGFTYDDKLKITDIWETAETYAQLYFIYVIQSSLIISNYSVRTDGVLSDIGNFPLWDEDFFKRDSRFAESYSRHAHIIDFDSLRLGRKVIEENINADSFEFGVVAITEIGKERGNSIELSEKKKKDETTNQKNDLFNSWLKMVRHSATVDNFPFVRVITDEQRPESWGADARDLCEIVHIRESGETRLAMPFFSLAELLYDLLLGKFTGFYYDYRYNRADNTLSMYLLKGFITFIRNYYVGIYNRFGYCRLSVDVERGTQDGQAESNKYYLMSKKIYSKRFSTDCFSDFFTEKALRSSVGIDDLSEYATEKATFDELSEQKSYFVNELLNGLKNNDRKN